MQLHAWFYFVEIRYFILIRDLCKRERSDAHGTFSGACTLLLIPEWRTLQISKFSYCVAVQIAQGSTIIDLTEREPALIRRGKGDPSIFVSELAYA